MDELAKLAVRPSLRTGNRSADSVRRMIELAHLWTRAALPVDQNAAKMQSRVNDAIVARISGMIAESRWWGVEREALGDACPSRERLLGAVGDSGAERAAAATLIDIAGRVPAHLEARAAAFAEALEAHGWQVDGDLVELILRLCTAPGSMAPVDGRASTAIRLALERPALVRLARAFALVISDKERVSGESLLEEWPWD